MVKLEVFDVNGQKLTTLVNSKLPAGKHSFTTSASNYMAGTYTYTLSVDDKIVLSKKMMVIK